MGRAARVRVSWPCLEVHTWEWLCAIESERVTCRRPEEGDKHTDYGDDAADVEQEVGMTSQLDPD